MSLAKKSKVKNDTYTSRFLLYFAGFCVFVCFLYIFLITFAPIPKENQRYADVCLGFLLGTFMATIIQFFYGSSNQSKEKDNALDAVTKQYQAASNHLKTITELSEAISNSSDELDEEITNDIDASKTTGNGDLNTKNEESEK
jgi:amino acid permease